MLLMLPFVGITGCGINLSESLYQAGAAAGRTALDLWLTDLANQLADAAVDTTDPAPDGDGMAPDDDADGSGGSDGPGFGATDGDATDGEAVYVSTGCAGCHCDDGVGGCALSAPAVAGAAADVLDAVLRGEAIHPVRVDISDPDLADLEAYLTAL